MNSRLFNEEYLIRRFQKCKSPLDLEADVYWLVISYIEDQVTSLYEKVDSKKGLWISAYFEEKDGLIHAYLPGFTNGDGLPSFEIIPNNSLDAEYNYYLYFEYEDFQFYCPFKYTGKDLGFPESILDWICDRFFVLYCVMPTYLAAKGKIQKIYQINKTSLDVQANALLQKYCFGAKMEISEKNTEGVHVWNMSLSMDTKTEEPVSLGFRYCYYPRYKRSLFRMLESLFRFFGSSYCLSLTYKNAYSLRHYAFEQEVDDYIDEDTGEIVTQVISPNAPAYAYPFYEAFCQTFPDMSLKMFPIEDTSGQKVMISLSLPFRSSSAILYFKLDLFKYTPEDFLKVIKRLDKDLFATSRKIEKTGNIVDLSILIDFEKALCECF